MNNSILNEGYNSKGPKFIKAKGSYVFDGKKLIDLSFVLDQYSWSQSLCI